MTIISGRLQPPVPAPIEKKITLSEGAIKIGGKGFRLNCGKDKAITQHAMIDRVKGLLEKYHSVPDLENAVALVADKVKKEGGRVKIVFTSEGAKVVHVPKEKVATPAAETVQTVKLKESVKVRGESLHSHDQILEQYDKKLQTITKEVKEHVAYVAGLQKLLLDKGYSPQEVKEAITTLLKKGHLKLDYFFKGKLPSEFIARETTVADLLHNAGDEALKSALLSVRDSYTSSLAPNPKKLKKCMYDIVVFTLSNMRRNEKVIEVEGVTVGQHMVKGTGDLSSALKEGQDNRIGYQDIVEIHKGLPSEADKAKGIEEKNTNLGYAVQYSSDGAPNHVIVGRSGKSDHKERAKEVVLTACFEQLACKKQAGFKEIDPIGGQEAFEFQHVITSYLDSSLLKAIPERLQGLWKTPEDEIHFLDQVIKASEDWPKEGYRILVDKADGSGTMVIVLKKPIVCNQLFSTTLRGFGTENFQISDMGQGKSDKINFAAHQAFLDRYLDPYLKSREMQGSEAFKNFKTAKKALFKTDDVDLSSLSTSQLLKQPKFFKSKAFYHYQLATARLLHEQIKVKSDSLTEQALFTLFFRRAAPNSDTIRDTVINEKSFSLKPKRNEEMHAADLEIWRNILMKRLRLSQSKQCKSGTDRTAIGVALAVAQDRYFQKYSQEFIPDMTSGEELLFFKNVFREALKEFGIAVAVETKGYPGIKWGGGVPLAGGIGNPVAYKYLFLENENEVPDVLGLKSEDLKAKGKTQYKGKLYDPIGMYGQSEPAYAKKVRKIQKKLGSQKMKPVTESVKKAVSEFVCKDLGCHELEGALLLSEALEVSSDFHIRKLHLNRPIENTGQTRLERLDDKIKNLRRSEAKKDMLQLFVLEQLKALWERRVESKKIPRAHVLRLAQVTTPFEHKEREDAFEITLEEVSVDK